MTGDDGCRVFEPRRPQEAMDRRCQACGVSERQRQRPLGMWVRALVMSAGTPGGADQAEVLRSALEGEGPPVTRAAPDPSHTSRRAAPRGTAPPPAPGLAAGRLRSVHRPGLRSARSRGPTPLAQARGVAHTCRERSPLAPSAVRMRSVARVEPPAGGSREKP
jgi:hypothetical protein